MTDAPLPDRNRLLLCATCLRDSGDSVEVDAQILISALAQASLAQEFVVEPVDCLGGCEEPVSLGLQGPDRATYVFNGLAVARDCADIMALCRAYGLAPAGWIADARPLGRLRFRLRARVPAMDQGTKKLTADRTGSPSTDKPL